MPLTWEGNLKDTFSRFSTWGDRPDPDSLPAFLSSHVLPLLKRYAKLPQGSDEARQAIRDISAFHSFASSFVEYYLRQEKVPRAAFTLLETQGAASQVSEQLGGDPYYVSGESYTSGDSRYAQELLKLDYSYLEALDKSGLRFSPAFLYYIISGNDVKENAARNSESRKRFIQHMVERYPYTQLYLPKNHKRAQEMLRNPNFGESPEDQALFGVSDSYTAQHKLRQNLMNAPAKSGAPAKETLPFFIANLSNPAGRYVSYGDISPFPHAEMLKLLQAINDGRLEVSDYALDHLMKMYPYKLDSIKPDEARKLRAMDRLVPKMQGGESTDSYRILGGMGTVEETVEFLRKNPDKADKLIIDDFIPKPLRVQVQKEITTHQARVASDVNEAWKEAVRKGVVQVVKAADDPSIMNFLLKEGTENGGLSEEEIRAYANYLTIYRFNTYSLKQELKKANSTKVGGMDVNGNWSGLFMPRFNDPSSGPTPAIMIKTDAYNQLEYLKGLAENLKMALSSFTQATEKHEGAHALHYLGVGDAIMESPVMEQQWEKEKREQYLDSLSDEEREQVPPKRWESDEMLYLNDPAELYARVHGDIPHLQEVFRERIESQRDDPLVAKAVENQWIEDVVNSMAGIGSGGTNAERLQRDLEQGIGYFPKITDPVGAINRKLDRQENVLRGGYREQIEEERRKATLGVLKEISQKKREIMQAQQAGDYEQESQAQEELAQLQKELRLIRTRRVFDVEGIGDLILAGYLRDYMRRLTDAVGEGRLTTDRILNPDAADTIREREEALKKGLMDGEDTVEKPTMGDIRSVGDYMIDVAKPIPAGRLFDSIIKTPLPPDQRSGFYPHLQEPQATPQQQTASEHLRWYKKA